jgi:hypothetical protein
MSLQKASGVWYIATMITMNISIMGNVAVAATSQHLSVKRLN